MHQVGLTYPSGAVKEERVGVIGVLVGVRTRRSVGRHKTRHCEGEAVVGALHKGIEGQLFVDGLGGFLGGLGNGRVDIDHRHFWNFRGNVLEMNLHAGGCIDHAQRILDEVGKFLGEFRGVFVLGKFHRQRVVHQRGALTVHSKVVHKGEFAKLTNQIVTDLRPQRLCRKRIIRHKKYSKC